MCDGQQRLREEEETQKQAAERKVCHSKVMPGDGVGEVANVF